MDSQFVLRRLPCPLPRFRAFTRLTTAAFHFLSRLLLAPALLGVFDLRQARLVLLEALESWKQPTQI